MEVLPNSQAGLKPGQAASQSSHSVGTWLSQTHQDVMISDETTTVLADGQVILENGRWTGDLA